MPSPSWNSSSTISGTGTSFADRQRDLFASLDAADREREGRPPTQPLPVQSEDRRDDDDQGRSRLDRRRRPPTKQFRGKESIFKRPELPAPRRATARHSVPDHQRNPHKYTKYTLGDVSSQDMSDRSNTATALSFLQELMSRKDQDPMVVSDKQPKAIVFKSSKSKGEPHTTCLGAISSVTTTETSEEADRPSFRSSKVVMPEYVVGQKKTIKKKSSSSFKPSKSSEEAAKKMKTKEITLGHLMDEEDE